MAASYEVRPGYYRVLKLTQDLCDAALIFAINNLKPGGKFVCKYFTGPEDKFLKKRLDKVFRKVYREKPNSSRKESREMYFIGIGKTKNITKERVYRHC